MRERIIKDYGWCKISTLEDDYYMSFDEGGVAVKMNGYKISKDDALIAIENEEEAERIARQIQSKNA